MPESQTSAPTHRAYLRWRAGATLIILVLVLVGSGWLSQTDLVPEVVDVVRGLPFVGPERMAALENAYYEAQDAWTLYIYQHTHLPVVISNVSPSNLSATTALTPTAAQFSASIPTPTVTVAFMATPMEPSTIPIALQRTPTTPSTPPTLLPATPATPPVPLAPMLAKPTLVVSAGGITPPHPPSPIPPLILSDPVAGEGIWTSIPIPLGKSQQPPLWHTFYRPDPTRPYAQVDLVWMDTSQTQLHLVPGTIEPRAIDGTHGPGVIPPAVQASGQLLAAWNGGFLTISGAYGMMVDHHIVLPPRDDLATLTQYADGHFTIDVWGRNIQMTPDVVSFRQNGPILIDRGVLNENGLVYWGASLSGATHIWRSGLGLTADGALIYGAGDRVSAQTLGQALQRAGVVEAMQLDVNAWHVFFFTYALTSKGLVSTKLNAAMPGPLRLYLTPYGRDFMYLTLNQ